MSISIKFLRSSICMFLLVLLYPFPASSAPLDKWHVRNSVPGGYTLNAVTFGNGMFVAVGSGGTILSSPDGANWTARTSGVNAGLYGVTHGNSMFVAVGSGGTILTSPDGMNWTKGSSGTSTFLGSVAYGNGVFVASGPIPLTSQDGVTWTSVVAGWLDRVRFGNGKFVAYASPGPPGLFESSNGITWEYKPSANGILVGYFMDIALQGGTYIIVGRVGTFSISPLPASEEIYTSSDGTNWLLTNNSHGALDGRPFWINGINFNNGNFVAASSAGRVFHSPDGYSWTIVQTPTTDWLNAVAFGNRMFVAVGENGAILQSDPLIKAVEVPALSDWGKLLFMILGGGAAAVYMKKRRIGIQIL